MKQKQPKQQPKTKTDRKPVQELTDEQLQQVVGGVNPQPLPPGSRYHPPNPCLQ